MPDIRDTIFAKVMEHLEGTVKADGSLFTQGKDYGVSRINCKLWLSNNSEILARSWADKRGKKLGSLEASCAIVEELTENNEEDNLAIKYLRMRIGRLPAIPQNFIIYCTNPDSPQHFAYEYFDIEKRQAGITEGLPATRHVYFSKTSDNPFLPEWYISQLEQDLDPKLAARMIYGQWVELDAEGIYYQYTPKNYVDSQYTVDTNLPIYISFDFNIGYGKPLSCCFSQVKHTDKGPEFHFFDEVVIEGIGTDQIMQEIDSRGLLDYETTYIIHGDATGGARSTQSKLSNYDIIKEHLSRRRDKSGNSIKYIMQILRCNPPIRDRHARVNAYMCNMHKDIRLFVYKNCKMLDKGFRLVAFKKGGNYIEDDSRDYQHVTTAAGYHVYYIHREVQANRSSREVKIR